MLRAEAAEKALRDARDAASGQADQTVQVDELKAQLSSLREGRDAETARVREDNEVDLRAARQEAADERRLRQEAEARVVKAQDELEAKAAQLTEAERRIDEAFEQRLSAIFDSQETARRERERVEQEVRAARSERQRLEKENAEAAERHETALAAAERRAAEACSLLEEARAGGERPKSFEALVPDRRQRSPDPQAPPQAVEPSEQAPAVANPEPSLQEPSGTAEPAAASEPEGGSNGHVESEEPEQRVPAFHQPPSKSESRLSLPGMRRGRKRNKKQVAHLTCAVTGAQAPTDSEWALRRQGWIVSSDNALSPEAQADGWQLPEGAALPFRKLSHR